MDEARARQLLDDRLHELDESSGDVRAERDEFRDEVGYEGGRLSQHPGEYATDVQEVNEHDLALGGNRQERADPRRPAAPRRGYLRELRRLRTSDR